MNEKRKKGEREADRVRGMTACRRENELSSGTIAPAQLATLRAGATADPGGGGPNHPRARPTVSGLDCGVGRGLFIIVGRGDLSGLFIPPQTLIRFDWPACPPREPWHPPRRRATPPSCSTCRNYVFLRFIYGHAQGSASVSCSSSAGARTALMECNSGPDRAAGIIPIAAACTARTGRSLALVPREACPTRRETLSARGRGTQGRKGRPRTEAWRSRAGRRRQRHRITVLRRPNAGRAVGMPLVPARGCRFRARHASLLCCEDLVVRVGQPQGSSMSSA